MYESEVTDFPYFIDFLWVKKAEREKEYKDCNPQPIDYLASYLPFVSHSATY